MEISRKDQHEVRLPLMETLPPKKKGFLGKDPYETPS